jgi:hypothetical protein
MEQLHRTDKKQKKILLGEAKPRPICILYGKCPATDIAHKGNIYVCTVDDYKQCPQNPALM